MNYEDDIRIDETALDVEWLEQPSLMIKYARNAALTRQRLDLAKELLDLTKAELDKKIRTNPDIYAIEKVTETAVQNTIITQDEYKTASNAFIDAKFEADVASVAVRALEHRKDALENLVRLHGQQYFAGPRIPRDIREERKIKEKAVDTGVSRKLSRTK